MSSSDLSRFLLCSGSLGISLLWIRRVAVLVTCLTALTKSLEGMKVSLGFEVQSIMAGN